METCTFKPLQTAAWPLVNILIDDLFLKPIVRIMNTNVGLPVFGTSPRFLAVQRSFHILAGRRYFLKLFVLKHSCFLSNVILN